MQRIVCSLALALLPSLVGCMGPGLNDAPLEFEAAFGASPNELAAPENPLVHGQPDPDEEDGDRFWAQANFGEEDDGADAVAVPRIEPFGRRADAVEQPVNSTATLLAVYAEGVYRVMLGTPTVRLNSTPSQFIPFESGFIGSYSGTNSVVLVADDGRPRALARGTTLEILPGFKGFFASFDSGVFFVNLRGRGRALHHRPPLKMIGADGGFIGRYSDGVFFLGVNGMKRRLSETTPRIVSAPGGFFGEFGDAIEYVRIDRQRFRLVSVPREFIETPGGFIGNYENGTYAVNIQGTATRLCDYASSLAPAPNGFVGIFNRSKWYRSFDGDTVELLMSAREFHLSADPALSKAENNSIALRLIEKANSFVQTENLRDGRPTATAEQTRISRITLTPDLFIPIAAADLPPDEEHGDCPICTEPLTGLGALVKTTKCNHMYCEQCAKALVDHAKDSRLECSVCRTELRASAATVTARARSAATAAAAEAVTVPVPQRRRWLPRWWPRW